MKHEDQYNALIGLAVGDVMDKGAFDVVSGLDGEQSTIPRCAFFEGEVKDGDKVDNSTLPDFKTIFYVCIKGFVRQVY